MSSPPSSDPENEEQEHCKKWRKKIPNTKRPCPQPASFKAQNRKKRLGSNVLLGHSRAKPWSKQLFSLNEIESERPSSSQVTSFVPELWASTFKVCKFHNFFLDNCHTSPQ